MGWAEDIAGMLWVRDEYKFLLEILETKNAETWT
jgi:hypothetical protein